MRVRKRKNTEQRLEKTADYLIRDVSEFEALHDLHMEIGCGKGAFISQLAASNPDIKFIAIEKERDIIVAAAEKVCEAQLKNVRLYPGDVNDLNNIENSGFCSRIYLNFSDPWPRTRHAKRRLTAPGFLELYKKLLAPHGEIHMKTDNENLFDFSLAAFSEAGFEIAELTRDLHKEDTSENIMTEYEQRFAAQGLPIYRLVARR